MTDRSAVAYEPDASSAAAFIRLLHSERSLMRSTVLLAYFYETDDTHMLGMGGYLIREDSYVAFQSEWSNVCALHEVPYIHMKEFSVHKKLSHITGEKKFALFKDAIHVLRRHALCGCAAMIDRSELEQRLPSPQWVEARISRTKLQPLSPYAAVFGACLHLLTDWCIKNGYGDEEISVMLDTGSGYGEHARGMFNDMKYKQWKTPYKLHALGFGDDVEQKPLQAVDILAYEARREFGRRFGKRNRDLSELLKSLLGSDVPHWCVCLSGDFLTNLAFGIHPLDPIQHLRGGW